jgi:hypothetical protein
LHTECQVPKLSDRGHVSRTHCVAAWCLLQALAGRGVSVGGSVQRLQMQTRSLHWDVDDQLATTQVETVARRLAVSCKGNVQVSANGLPESFAAQAWRLWTKADSPFQRASDRLVLGTQGTRTNFQNAWSDIKKFASGDDVALALAQMTVKITMIFELVAGRAFRDEVPRSMLELLRTYAARDPERQKEIAVLALRPTYEIAARCLLTWVGYKKSKWTGK